MEYYLVADRYILVSFSILRLRIGVRMSDLGSLLLGVHQDKKLVFIGRVGTGFSERTLKDVHTPLVPLITPLVPLITPKCPFTTPPQGKLNHPTWITLKNIGHVHHLLIQDERSLRKNKLYLDYLQNRTHQTLAAPHCLRPRPHATVSTPLAWNEVTKYLDPRRFTMHTILKRLEKIGDIWKVDSGQGINLPSCLKKLERFYSKGVPSRMTLFPC